MVDTKECKVESVWDRSDSVESISESSIHDVNISTYLYNTFKKGKFTDVEFAVRKEMGSECVTFSAHKLILSIWSIYFADKFNSSTKTVDNIISVKNVDPVAFEAMLRFMYGVFPPMKTPKEALEIYKVSEKFSVLHLKKASRSRVVDIEPDNGNVFEVLEASIEMDLPHIKEGCLKVIQKNTAEVFESADVSQISASIIREILSLHKFSLASEYDLIEWIFRWAKNEFCSSHRYSTVREVLLEFLPKLYFVSLSSEEFAQFYKIHENFFDADEGFKILMNIALRNSLPLPEWQDSEFNPRVYTGRRIP